jgi:hypothetical protein
MTARSAPTRRAVNTPAASRRIRVCRGGLVRNIESAKSATARLSRQSDHWLSSRFASYASMPGSRSTPSTAA